MSSPARTDLRARAASAPRGAAERRPRRHRTRQREQLLEQLRSRPDHPTAAELHGALRAGAPQLSLGTVYRNLEVLVESGEIEAVPTSRGALRYDGNPTPHHHFSCERCGALSDVELPIPRGLGRELRERYALRARRIRVEFIGVCVACEESVNPESSPEKKGNE